MSNVTLAEKYRYAMQVHGITLVDIARELGRTDDTVRQRLRNDITFPRHYNTYKKALDKVIARKEAEKLKAMEGLE